MKNLAPRFSLMVSVVLVLLYVVYSNALEIHTTVTRRNMEESILNIPYSSTHAKSGQLLWSEQKPSIRETDRIIEDTTSLTLNEVWYPSDNDIAYFPALSQPYSVLYFPLDNTNENLCLINSSSFASMNSNLNASFCMEYFCACSIDSRVCSNLTMSLTLDSGFRDRYFRMINYCIHCNGDEASAFRNEISKSSGQCTGKFPTFGQIQQSLMGHCNTELSDSEISSIVSSGLSESTLNLGLLDWRYYKPKQFFSTKYTNNRTSIQSGDNTLHLFETLFRNREENPIMCWCRNEIYGGYAYKCGDAYYNFLVRFKYIGTPWWFMFFFTLYLITMTIYNTIPLFHSKRASIKKKIEDRMSRKATTVWKTFMMVCFEELFIADLRPAILFFIYLETMFFFVENMVCFLWNFKFIHATLRNIQLWGCFRALAIYSLAFAFSTLMVQWSHIVDLIKSNQNKKNLSKYNLLLLVSNYIFNLFLIAIAIILCVVLKTSVYLFALAGVAMIFVPSILIISFTTYGILIYKKLRSYKNVNLTQMRFIKFILIFNTALFCGFGLAIVFVPTFISTWDMYGIFVALFKNFAIDSAGLVATYMITYILINEHEFLKCYGVTTSTILICRKFSESNVSIVSPVTLPSPNSARDRALSSTSATITTTSKPTSNGGSKEELKKSTTTSSIQTTTSSSPLNSTPTSSSISTTTTDHKQHIVDDPKNLV